MQTGSNIFALISYIQGACHLGKINAIWKNNIYIKISTCKNSSFLYNFHCLISYATNWICLNSFMFWMFKYFFTWDTPAKFSDILKCIIAGSVSPKGREFVGSQVTSPGSLPHLSSGCWFLEPWEQGFQQWGPGHLCK